MAGDKLYIRGGDQEPKALARVTPVDVCNVVNARARTAPSRPTELRVQHDDYTDDDNALECPLSTRIRSSFHINTDSPPSLTLTLSAVRHVQARKYARQR